MESFLLPKKLKKCEESQSYETDVNGKPSSQYEVSGRSVLGKDTELMWSLICVLFVRYLLPWNRSAV